MINYYNGDYYNGNCVIISDEYIDDTNNTYNIVPSPIIDQIDDTIYVFKCKICGNTVNFDSAIESIILTKHIVNIYCSDKCRVVDEL